jgi:hypothetical protein
LNSKIENFTIQKLNQSEKTTLMHAFCAQHKTVCVKCQSRTKQLMRQINEENLLGQWDLLKERYFSDLSSLLFDSFFTKVKDSKIQLDSFVFGFILMLIKGGNSFNQWSMQTRGISETCRN